MITAPSRKHLGVSSFFNVFITGIYILKMNPASVINDAQHSVLIHHRIRRVDHGIETNRQREKIGVILLEMLHIEDPFPDEMTENPLYVSIDVFFVTRRNTIERLPGPKLFNGMKRCPEKISKIFMLKQILVFQQAQEEASFSGHELLQAGECVTIDADPDVASAQILERRVKILFFP